MDNKHNTWNSSSCYWTFCGFYCLLYFLNFKKIKLKNLSILSIILILFSSVLFLIYPPNATIIIIPLACIILFKKNDISIFWLKKITFVFLLIIIGFIISTIYIKFLNSKFFFFLFQHEIIDVNYKNSFIDLKDVFSRFLVICRMILPGFFNPLQILTGPEFDLIFLIIFMILFLIYFFIKSKLEVLLTFTIIGVFILFSIGVHFVTKDIAIGVRNVHPTFLICALCFGNFFII